MSMLVCASNNGIVETRNIEHGLDILIDTLTNVGPAHTISKVNVSENISDGSMTKLTSPYRDFHHKLRTTSVFTSPSKSKSFFVSNIPVNQDHQTLLGKLILC